MFSLDDIDFDYLGALCDGNGWRLGLGRIPGRWVVRVTAPHVLIYEGTFPDEADLDEVAREVFGRLVEREVV